MSRSPSNTSAVVQGNFIFILWDRKYAPCPFHVAHISTVRFYLVYIDHVRPNLAEDLFWLLASAINHKIGMIIDRLSSVMPGTI
jgi:hypothetical protein